MTTPRLFLSLSIISFFYACTPSPSVEINISNKLDIDRKNETIEISLDKIGALLTEFTAEQLVVRDGETDQVLLSQLIDLNDDGTNDQLIFQCEIAAGATKHFHLEGTKDSIQQPENTTSTYARFVPERIDDFAWENDRVAFRTYGPKAQQITESGAPGGTLSSGIDCWLKRVDYPIIDKWYSQDLQDGKSYHKDHGEGLDNYHVGDSRGTGGIGIWNDSVLLTSKNFESWKIIANGPIRTIFELDYGTWQADSLSVDEVKQISIDLGSNLFKNTLLIANAHTLPNVTLGITMHDKKGESAYDVEQGWFRYMEPIDDSHLSTAIVVDPSLVKEFIENSVEQKDQSNLLVVCEPQQSLSYYAGYAWAKSNHFELPGEFDAYLANFAARLASPLEVEIIE